MTAQRDRKTGGAITDRPLNQKNSDMSKCPLSLSQALMSPLAGERTASMGLRSRLRSLRKKRNP